MELNYMKMQIFEIGLLILAAYIGGMIARKLKIGEVIGQIFGGILVGPHFLEIVHKFLVNHEGLKQIFFFKPIYHFYDTTFPEYANILESYHFFVFLFLGLIAFSIGEELHLDRIKEVGAKAAIICVIQGLLTWGLLFLGFRFIFHFDIILSLILGSIGIATAPALTFLLMNKLRIEGSLRKVLANVIVLDNIMEVVFFSLFLSIGVALSKGGNLSSLSLTGHIIKDLLLAILIGGAVFFILKLTIKKRLPEDVRFAESDSFLSTVLSEHPTPSVEILLIILGVVSIGVAVAIHFNLPFLITAVVAGVLISNFHSHAIFDSLKIENVMPIMNLLFFAIIGASVRLESFSKETIIFVIAYLILRTIAKLFGNWLGCKVTKQDPKVTASLPKLMLPQAGVAAVETILVAAMLKGHGGGIIFDTIIPALVIFELVGAWLSERTLIKWKNWTVGEREALLTADVSEQKMSLSNLVQDRIIEMMASNKEQAVFELSQLFVKEMIVPETKIITDSVLAREKLASTAIGKGIALPHCRISSIDTTKVACGFLKNPIDWNAPDKEPVDLIFLIITPDRFPEQHLQAIKSISLALRIPEFKKNLKYALETDQAQTYIKNISAQEITSSQEPDLIVQN